MVMQQKSHEFDIFLILTNDFSNNLALVEDRTDEQVWEIPIEKTFLLAERNSLNCSRQNSLEKAGVFVCVEPSGCL